MNDLHDKPTSELLGVYNAMALATDRTVLKAWKGSKDALIAKIEALRDIIQQIPSAEPEFDEAITALADMDQDDFDRGIAALETAAEPEVTEPEVTETVGGGRTIRATAIDLLCKVVYHEDRNKKSSDENRVEPGTPGARTVGLAYDDIIDAIRSEFPDCNTSVACLRWYSVKIRVEEHGYEGLRLPQRRPRAKPRSPK